MRSVIRLWPSEKPPTGSDLRSVKAVQEILVQKRPKLVSSKLGREKQCSRFTMSQLQKNPECAADQGQTCEETQSLQDASVSRDVEEPCTSSCLLMASSLKGQTCEETQGLQVAAVFSDVEEPCTSSCLLMASSLKAQTCEGTQGLQVAAVSSDVLEPCTSSRLLMASSLKGQTCEETQGLQIAEVSSDEEEPCTSSHLLMASSLKVQTCEETQGLQVAAVSSDVEEPCTSSHLLMASSLKAQTCEETQGLQVAAVSSDEEEPYTSSHLLMASSLKGQTCEGTQGLQVAAVSIDVEEPCTSSRLLMASSLKGQTCEETEGLQVAAVSSDVEEPCSSSLSPSDSEDETSSTSESFESTCTSSGESDEDISSQEEQDYPVNPPFPQDTRVDSKVDFLVNYMLYKYQMKEIMSMTDILRLIVREDEYRFHEILMRAAERMEMVFGLDVKEVDPVNHCYALSIKLGLTYDGMRSDEYSFPKTGFLILILGVVFMKGNRATEDEIWEVLNPMGIYDGMNNFIFGDPKKLINDEFVKEQYLVYQPVANSYPVQYEYVWGPRARVEISKMKMLEFLAKVHGTAPTAFHSQYEEALVEEERTLATILNGARPRSSSGASSSPMGSSSNHI
ncbi:hypothetical protein STEG23_025665 [Scotinomys teguina]